MIFCHILPFLYIERDASQFKYSRMVFNSAFASRTQTACRTILVLPSGRFHRTSSALPGLGTCPSTLSHVLIAHGARQLVAASPLDALISELSSLIIVTHRKTSPYPYYYSSAGTIRLVLMCCQFCIACWGKPV